MSKKNQKTPAVQDTAGVNSETTTPALQEAVIIAAEAIKAVSEENTSIASEAVKPVVEEASSIGPEAIKVVSEENTQIATEAIKSIVEKSAIIAPLEIKPISLETAESIKSVLEENSTMNAEILFSLGVNASLIDVDAEIVTTEEPFEFNGQRYKLADYVEKLQVDEKVYLRDEILTNNEIMTVLITANSPFVKKI